MSAKDSTRTNRPQDSAVRDDARAGGTPADPAALEPRRLTPTERLHEVTMAAMQRPASPPEHSVEITRNAKGVHQYEVTVRGYDLNDVLNRALDARAMLDEMLPYPHEEES